MKSHIYKLFLLCTLMTALTLTVMSFYTPTQPKIKGVDTYIPQSRTGIPLVLHQTWTNTEIASTLAPYILSWKKYHPDWIYRFWTNRDAGSMVRKDFPEMESLFHKYPKDIQKADVLRYMLLYRYGGIYSDLDIESLKPMDDLLDTYPCILAQDLPLHFPEWTEGFVTNALMICKPGHPFWKYVLGALQRYFEKYKRKVLWTTGPNMLEEVLREYLNVTSIPQRYHGVYLEKAEIYLAPWHMFLPSYDYRGKEKFQKFCEKKVSDFEQQKNGNSPLPGIIQQCAHYIAIDWRNSPTNDSYTDHHWVHIWNTPNVYKKFPTKVNITDLLEYPIRVNDNITQVVANIMGHL